MKLAIPLALLLLQPASRLWAQVDDEPPPLQQQEANQSAKASASPRIDIPAKIEESNPERFAERLAELLGIQVKMTTKAKAPFIVEAGSRTAAELLDKVAEKHSCTWRLEFEFLKEQPKGGQPTSKLDPMPSISMSGRLSISKALRLISKQIGCKVKWEEPPVGIVPFSIEGMPADLVLEELAQQYDRYLHRIIVIAPLPTPEEGIAAQEQEALEALMEQADQKARLTGEIEELAQQTVDDPTFPWESVAALISLSDTSPEEVENLIGQIRAEAESLKMLREFEADQPFSPAEGIGPPD